MITLIITIIVLITLAGIIVNIALDKNGLINKAKQAKNDTQKATIIENIKLDIAEEQTKHEGKIYENNFRDILSKYGQIQEDSEEKIIGLKTFIGGYEIPINYIYEEEIEKSVKEVTATEIAANPKEYYGKEVVNYKASDTDTNIWRIFYIDTANYFKDGQNTIYLKADTTAEGMLYQTNYSANTLVNKMNPIWANERKTPSLWENYEKGAAWLCDPDKWTKYCNSSAAKYAIGGPSLEMFIKSYNDVHKGEDNLEPLLCAYYSKVTLEFNASPGYVTRTKDRSTWGTGTSDRTLEVDYNGMYVKEDDWNYWIASPMANKAVGLVKGGYSDGTYGNCLGQSSSDTRVRFAPVVALKSTFKLEIK